MDAETLEALKGSIRKWEAIVAGTGADRGGSNCPLCQMFATNLDLDEDDLCIGCPVRAKTDLPECRDTPYFAFSRTASHYDDGSKRAETPVAVAAAQAELDFLRSLLPPAEEA